MDDWAVALLDSGIPASIGLILHLLIAGGNSLLDGSNLLKLLADRLENLNDANLSKLYDRLIEILQVPQAEHIDRELQQPELKRSPSMDKKLGDKYGTLFKRSSSIPLELATILEDDDAAETINSIVTQYFYKTDLAEFVAGLDKLGYIRNDLRTTTDLLRAVVTQKVENQMVVAQLVLHLLRDGFCADDQIRAAIQAVAAEFREDPTIGRNLVRIYAHLVNEEAAGFEQFEELFGEMRPIWSAIVGPFFMLMDKLKGDWIDDLMETPFWKDLAFLDVTEVAEKLAKLKEWGIISYLPQYEIAAKFAEQFDVHVLDQEDVPIDARDIAPIVFELLVRAKEAQLRAVAPAIKRWFAHSLDLVPGLAEKFGEDGRRVADALR
jgi:hypothetical protein